MPDAKASPNDSLHPIDRLIAVGSPAPDFLLPDQHRADWRLSDAVKQGPVLLSFFPFAFTGVCAQENACLTRELETMRHAGTGLIAISCDSPQANLAWAERDGYGHTILSDLHRAVVRAYGLHWKELNVSQRGSVIVGPDGAGGMIVRHAEAREPGQAMDWETIRQYLETAGA